MANPECLLSSERLGFRLPKAPGLPSLEKLDTDPGVRADTAVVEHETGECVGRAGVGLMEGGQVEVGYALLKDHWSCGNAIFTSISFHDDENLCTPPYSASNSKGR